MPHATRAGDVLAGRYRLVDLLSESGGGRFWRAHDQILERHVALHVISADDPRADLLQEAARRSATVLDQRILRVLDVERIDHQCFVVNEWGSGTSLDIMLASNGPLSPRRGAWLVSEVADSIAIAHAHGVAHGLLSPENVLLDTNGSVRIIGFCVDAALHGMPPGDPHHDVVDLAGLLHATLTGRWAGVSPSAVPRAPEKHGRVLRPRQVRAGVPRLLDDLCDELLNPRGQPVREVRDLSSARGIQSVLAEFVGDAAGLAAAIAAGNPEKNETVVLPAVPEILARPHPDDWVEPEAETEPEPDPAPRPEPIVDVPTQAGLPIFDDENDEVSWLRARDEPAPPPPPFEEPPERPLFAPEARKPRFPRPDEGPVVARGDEYWPFDQVRSSGSGLIPAVDGIDDTREQVPGRNWMRLAMLIAVGLVLLVAIAIAFNLGRGKTPLGAEPDDNTSTSVSPTPTPEAAPTPITGLTAVDLDPQGDGEENPDQVGAAVDGDPATSWTTLTYKQQLGPGGLKRGVGMVVDLGQPYAVRRVDLTLVGAPTALSLYVSETAPTNPEELTAAAQVQAPTDTVSVELDQAPTGRYVTIWLTSLPRVDGGFKGGIVDVVVAGS
ncbi:protein kinase family protein [uncultured Nocardioides sp.]|uniref:protein kinase family protein n=1 Tax=uncultured Nocardioides sp. TaxID=198441 RepID=UPI00261C0B0B|nr:protein kinase family protein [uncultured Nocardioides sp.]